MFPALDCRDINVFLVLWLRCDEYLWFLQTCPEMPVCQENVSIEIEIFVVNMQICQ